VRDRTNANDTKAYYDSIKAKTGKTPADSRFGGKESLLKPGVNDGNRVLAERTLGWARGAASSWLSNR
jgi:hypothetical protein